MRSGINKGITPNRFVKGEWFSVSAETRPPLGVLSHTRTLKDRWYTCRVMLRTCVCVFTMFTHLPVHLLWIWRIKGDIRISESKQSWFPGKFLIALKNVSKFIAAVWGCIFAHMRRCHAKLSADVVVAVIILWITYYTTIFILQCEQVIHTTYI